MERRNRDTVTDSNRIVDSIIKKFACGRAAGMLLNYGIFHDEKGKTIEAAILQFSMAVEIVAPTVCTFQKCAVTLYLSYKSRSEQNDAV